MHSIPRNAVAFIGLAAVCLFAGPALADPPDHLLRADAPDHAVWLDELDLSHARQGWGDPQARKSVQGKPLTLDGQTYPRGFGTHANGILVVDLHGDAQRFEAMVGLDDEVKDTGSVRFAVHVDGKLAFRTGVFKPGDPSQHLAVDLTGAQKLILRVDDGGDGKSWDHGDWAAALIHLQPDAKTKPATAALTFPVPPIHSDPAPDAPRINHPIATGSQPGHPFLWRVPTTGKRPMTFQATGLPETLSINDRGVITGVIESPGVHQVTITASNEHGTDSRQVLLVCGDYMLALTPPMGWNSWNVWARIVTQEHILDAARVMIETGLADRGFNYVNIDDCWMRKPTHDDPKRAGIPRDDDGNILPNAYFPDMKGLTDAIHAMGLKAGIYTSPGPLTCQKFEGAHLHEYRDARSFADWGFDYLKYDWCGYSRVASRKEGRATHMRPYRIMRHALDQVDRDIVYSLCQYGMREVWEWANDPSIRGNCWRTTGDIHDAWDSMAGIGFRHSDLAKHAGPGHWNDPDMLVIGKVGWGSELRQSRMGRAAEVTHITLWSLVASPLLLGNDLTDMEPYTLALVSNPEVLAVNQDPLGKAATRISEDGGLEVWARPLWDGTWAVGLFNRSVVEAAVRVDWADLWPNPEAHKMPVRDLWQRQDLGSHEGGYETRVLPHAAVFLKVGTPRPEDDAINDLVTFYEDLIERRAR